MRVELRTYQATAVESLLFCLDEAIRSAGRRPQARGIAFSAPTGAGKTVMMAATIEELLVGGEIAARAGIPTDPTLTFLWLSDRPDLNEQSRRRILNDANGLSADRFVMIENDFDRETLAPGTIYFLNFQKLREGSLLTRIGDSRASTIWEIIAATQAARPGKLIVIIDEAHRGLSAREQNEAQTISSHFVRGGEGTIMIRGLPGAPLTPFPPIQIVVGVSATPERFNAYLGTEGGRTRAEVRIEPQHVRGSGLIKDRIVLVGPEELELQQGEVQWTLLAQASKRVQELEAAWNAFTDANPEIPVVVPVLVVQVADGNSTNPTATSLVALVDKLRDTWPALSPQSIVHCFNNFGPLEPVPGWVIHHRDPSEIADDQNIRVVLFKTALNTGWDCPRAEVMMSFRTLADQTAIAQLVGRMVRTPLGSRVPGDDVLNSTYLYLPLFDQKNLKHVKDYLTADAFEVGAEVVAASETQTLTVRPGGEAIFETLKLLPTEIVGAERPIPDVKRLLKLCRLFEQDGILNNASRDSVLHMLGQLQAEYDRRAAMPGFEERIAGRGTVSIAQLTVADGVVTSEDIIDADVGPEDLERMFRAASSVIADELGLAWVRARYDEDDPLRAKLEFLELMRSSDLLRSIGDWAARRFLSLQFEFGAAISALPNVRRDHYVSLQRQGRSVQRALMAAETRVIFPTSPEAKKQHGHLYVQPGTTDTCEMVLNGWERAVLNEERTRPDFLAFLRNIDRKRWALSFSYDFNGIKPAYPDFLIFRGVDGRILTDILEPHRGEDSVAKAKGLAAFARQYGQWFGRIEMIRSIDNRIHRLALHDSAVQTKVLNEVSSHEDLLLQF
ncbi:DEAD/DEAH box helicase [Sinorhizobium fredii]|uniref:DEAD/DEAH box helicase n=1 Tax=Rhizobium fredii TaxID=380 RepID=UPI0035182ADB